jgi:hypothetical protein
MITRRLLLANGTAAGVATILTPAFGASRPQLVLIAPPGVMMGTSVQITYELRLAAGQSCSLLVLAADRQDHAELGAFHYPADLKLIRGVVRTRIDRDQQISASAILSDHQIPTARIAIRALSLFS